MDTVILDKTGTVTNGKPVLTDVIVADGFNEEEITFSRCGRKNSEHPLAEAIVEGIKEKKIDIPSSETFEAIPDSVLNQS